ncbi:MAG: hypothetical protein ACI4AM_03730 [Muribaculaceae bacterium]
MWDYIFALLFGAAVGAAVGAATITIIDIIDQRSIQKAAKEQFKQALKAIIKEKKKNAVKVGIFGPDDNEIESDFEIESEKGVSSNLYVGQVIRL